MTTQTTGTDGKTSFTNILNGTYDLSVNKDGYDTFTETITILDNNIDEDICLVSSVTDNVFIWNATTDSNFHTYSTLVIESGGGQVDYGDGTTETLVEGSQSLTHTYTDTSKSYNVTVSKLNGLDDNCFMSCTGLTSVSLPKFTSLGRYCFKGCKNLNNIDLPLVTSLGNNCFYSTGLTTVVLANVTTLGTSCFDTCTSLTNVSLPKATTLGKNCFRGCTSLVSVDLPVVTSLGNYCFYEDSSLSTVSLPLVTSIGNYCFQNCTGLTSVELPSVTSIGNYCFMNCTSLTSVRFGTSTPPTLGTVVFSSVPSSCVIYVPSGSKSAYETALAEKGYSFNVVEY